MGTGLPGSLLLLDEAAGGPIRDSLHTSLFLVVLRCPFGPKHPCKEQRTAVSIPFIQLLKMEAQEQFSQNTKQQFLTNMDTANPADARAISTLRSQFKTIIGYTEFDWKLRARLISAQPRLVLVM